MSQTFPGVLHSHPGRHHREDEERTHPTHAVRAVHQFAECAPWHRADGGASEGGVFPPVSGERGEQNYHFSHRQRQGHAPARLRFSRVHLSVLACPAFTPGTPSSPMQAHAGISMKMLAFSHFLTNNPDLAQRVVLKQVRPLLVLVVLGDTAVPSEHHRFVSFLNFFDKLSTPRTNASLSIPV